MYCSSEKSIDCLSKNMIIVLLCLVLAGFSQGVLECKPNANTVLEKNATLYPDSDAIKAPRNNSNFLPNMTCTWNITAPVGNIVVLEILVFDYTANKTVCQEGEMFDLFDGPSTSSKLLYNSCNNPQWGSTRKMFFTNGPYALIEYKTTSNVNNVTSGFKSWRVTISSLEKTNCANGLVTNLTASTNTNNITSPYYDSYSYPKDSHCEWRITAPPGYIIKLEFKGTLSCSDDILKIYDLERNDLKDPVENICGSVTLRKMTSLGNAMYIKFLSNSTEVSLVKHDFIIYYTAFLPGTSCSPSNTADQNQNILIRAPNKGTIQSLNFPNKFPRNLDCKWKLIAPSGYAINLYMNTADIDVKSGCRYFSHYLRIYDGFKERASPRLGYVRCRFSYDRHRPSFYALSSGNKMRIEFKTGSGEPTGYGFQGNYTFEPLGVSGSCGEGRTGIIHLRGQSASFHSPGYQFLDTPKHPKNMTCIWNITVDPGYTILLSAKENKLGIGCSSEYAKVYDGARLSSELLGTMCKGKSFDVLQSSGNNMIVEMKTASSDQRGEGILMMFRAVKYEKFNFHYTYDNYVLKIKNKKTATVMSPWYPVEYPNNARCYYRFDAPFASIAKVNITMFHIQESKNCEADRVRVTDSLNEIGVFCGKKDAPLHLTSSSPNLIIDFKSDWRYSQYPGFKAVFYYVEDESFGPCKIQNKDNLFNVNASSGGVFYSPQFPKNIPANMMCTWVITAPEGQHTRLDFHTFDLDYSCSGKSQLEVRDGASSTSKKLGTYCSKNAPKSIFSMGRHLWVRFTSVQRGFVDKGFNASYSTVGTLPLSTSCKDGNLKKIKSSSGEFASHNYPLEYNNDMECKWQITVPDGKRVKLTFESFNLEESPGCSEDFVEVFDGMTKYADSLGKFCGGTKPEPIYSDGTWMYIRFKTNNKGQYPGFNASFEAVLSVKSIIMIVMFTLLGVGVLCSIIGWCCKGRVYSHNPDPSPLEGAPSTTGSNMELAPK